MKVIDARSGKVMMIGDVADHGSGEFVRLIDIDEGFFSATAVIEIGFVDHSKDKIELEQLAPVLELAKGGVPIVEAARGYRLVTPGPIVTIRRQIPLVVRFFHPSFFMQKVAFIPT